MTRARAAAMLRSKHAEPSSTTKLNIEARPRTHDAVLVLDILLLIFFTLHPVAVRTPLRGAAVAHVHN